MGTLHPHLLELCRGWRRSCGPPPPQLTRSSLFAPTSAPVQCFCLQSADQGAQPHARQAGRHPVSQDQLRRRLSTPLPVFLTENSATAGPCQKLSLYFFNDKTKSGHRGGWLEAGSLGILALCPCTQPCGLFLLSQAKADVCLSQGCGARSRRAVPFSPFSGLFPWGEPLPWGGMASGQMPPQQMGRSGYLEWIYVIFKDYIRDN